MYSETLVRRYVCECAFAVSARLRLPEAMRLGAASEPPLQALATSEPAINKAVAMVRERTDRNMTDLLETARDRRALFGGDADRGDRYNCSSKTCLFQPALSWGDLVATTTRGRGWRPGRNRFAASNRFWLRVCARRRSSACTTVSSANLRR